MIYRGIPGMEVHLYRSAQRLTLLAPGFVIDEVLAIDAVARRGRSPPPGSWPGPPARGVDRLAPIVAA